MKIRSVLLSLFVVFLPFQSCDVVQQVANDYGIDTGTGLTEKEVIQGLKSALEVGTNASVQTLSKTDGYLKDAAIKILLPSEINSAITQLKSTSAGRKIYDNLIKDIEEDMVISLNRAAENAAVKAKPIFVNAIKSMTIQDGFNILKGQDDAATLYLKNKTFNQLVDAFKPEIKTVLKKPLVFNKSSEAIYSQFVKSYNDVERADVINALKLSPIEESDLSAFVTQRALNGIFQKIALKEKDIRENPSARINDILKKVFGS
ncbi:DUF4197 domain-containing protein [Marivirga sp. S37H4]|uniref:DUF4197 domain-containing protein n=1 Tax=Marivirga aurantiaca TaxID=2802615 RepID=A0A935C5W6_9BACT|nr:DUF4197 domain-containing protein [Marivirga aurantiaca]MBK6264039.1 DUF4197 domain-containing protein [Marivirga aurantiaca]